ncbi:MAG: sigma-70 family RNA polymerase sigma factor [Candidatus Firestonebacteria bacterium]
MKKSETIKRLQVLRNIGPKMADKVLVKQSKEGNKESFEELVKKYQDKIYNLHLRLTGRNKEEAEDLTQETFLNAYKGFNNFREDANFFTWLYRIAINTFKTFYRGKPIVIPEPLENWENKIISPVNPEEKYMFKEVQEMCFSGLITHIPKSERLVFVLAEIQRISNKQIAEILNITEGTAKIRLHRARKRLIDYFKKKCELIKKDNPCKCSMWMDYVREQLKCLPEGWQYERQKIISAEIIDDNLSELQKIILFYRSLSAKEITIDIISQIQEKLSKKEIFK